MLSDQPAPPFQGELEATAAWASDIPGWGWGAERLQLGSLSLLDYSPWFAGLRVPLGIV